MAALKAVGAQHKAAIEADMRAIKSDKVETIYGYTQLKIKPEFDYSEHPEVAEAEKALELAKTVLELAQKKAQEAGAPKTEKRVFAFYRNKAVSARAKRNRIYVSTVIDGRKVNPKVAV